MFKLILRWLFILTILLIILCFAIDETIKGVFLCIPALLVSLTLDERF